MFSGNKVNILLISSNGLFMVLGLKLEWYFFPIFFNFQVIHRYYQYYHYSLTNVIILR